MKIRDELIKELLDSGKTKKKFTKDGKKYNVTFENINDDTYDAELTLWYAKRWKEIKERLDKK